MRMPGADLIGIPEGARRAVLRSAPGLQAQVREGLSPPRLALSNEQFRRDAESLTEFADVAGGEGVLAAEDFGNDAGGAENVHEIPLLQVVRSHQLSQRVHGRGGVQGVVPFLEVLDQHGQQLRKLPLGTGQLAAASVEVFEQFEVVLVLSPFPFSSLVPVPRSRLSLSVWSFSPIA